VKLGAIMLLAFGLSMDAMAVAAARGLIVKRVRARQVLLVAGLFGGFQALMPLLGWILGSRFGKSIEAWDHWLIFVLLGGIGGKMLWEAFHADDEGAVALKEEDAFRLKVMLLLAIATSIDAFAAGVALPLMKAPLGVSVVAIGLTAAALSAIGMFAGHRFGAALGSRLDALGGLVLIGLGVKTLVEHLTAG
jgi:manganese efflux pump family protein